MDPREELVRYGLKMVRAGLVRGTQGNLSVRTPEGVLISPKGVPLDELEPDELSLVSLAGVHLEGPAPSTELESHLSVYRRREDVGAVVHGHPPHILAYSYELEGLIKPLLAENAARGPFWAMGEIAPGSRELATVLADAAGRGLNCTILRGHGAFAWGKDLRSAMAWLEAMELEFQVRFLRRSL